MSSCFGPPFLLSSQSTNKLLGSVELLRTVFDLGLKVLLPLLCEVEVVLQELHLVHDLLQLSLLDRELGHDLVLLLGGLLQGDLLGLDDQVHVVEFVHRDDPARHVGRDLRHAHQGFFCELRVVNVLLQLLDGGRLNFLFLVLEQALQESTFVHHFLRSVPIVVSHFLGVSVERSLRLFVLEHADCLKHHSDIVWRLSKLLNVTDILRCNTFQGFFSFLKNGECIFELILSVLLNSRHLSSDLLSFSFFYRDLCCNFISFCLLSRHFDHLLIRELGRLDELRLELL
mmetsp:Transcript_42407/g.49465  ORF Transcript_42407/g.49465 Transcript_42407/m.49465 type:complete len:286 (-) Transcript_42407:7703-8560(-)